MNEEVINKIKIVANNALYFKDSRDYESALWKILALTAPQLWIGKIDDDDDDDIILEYMEPGEKGK